MDANVVGYLKRFSNLEEFNQKASMPKKQESVPELDETNVIEEVVDIARKINLEMGTSKNFWIPTIKNRPLISLECMSKSNTVKNLSL
ncbi:hypothetical protein TNCV_2558241 [Trichonephila clavipes]|nr:hypothetical protein TNCV_2558241 [Trichonephila clavipes]